MHLRSLPYIALLLLLCNCSSRPGEPGSRAGDPPKPARTVDAIRESGKLRALIAYSATSYFLYRGQPMGYEYELTRRLAADLGVELDLRIARNLDEMLEILQRGEVDLVAHGLAITRERKKKVAFADYLYLTRQVLVQRKPAGWRRLTRDQIRDRLVLDPVELIGDTVSLRKNSSYLERVNNLSQEIGGIIHVDTLDGNLATDEIIQMVVDKKIKYTFADQNLARINASHHPILDVSVPVSFSQRIAWAVSRDSPGLLKAINQWLEREKKETDYYVIFNKYFKNRRNFSRRVNSPFYSLNEGKISPYDTLIKREAREMGWDWRLLASVVYQESRFNATAQSWTGASGLMQLMPATAEELGVADRTNPRENLEAGARYLEALYQRFPTVTDSLQRIKFTLASYNCGYQHVEDARKLADVRGYDKDCWDENVDRMLLALSTPDNYLNEVVDYGYVRGEEPYRYVKQVFERFEHYRSVLQDIGPDMASVP
ncbi:MULTISPECIES: transglycosylase SLT domain-containing protein [unclassified Robiginitalea]|uniref:transglycosylase SLT domain-containing protein n=1 Tax=Robiginitalea TaxID=252306 RepID=UPI002349944E|nr:MULTISPECIES: transporter substrate-binding domain-containing protein [unclassified Robiginitalea]MDC6353120.1 transporter substrate-binding domain-containing protein [Robiginitalea sp. PM2]MDC6373713.1 transporter substrate-binding domain-containing protein [Robiginitalea sp. SP8]